MSEVKDNAIALAAQTSTAWSQIDSFSHQYDRGGNVLVNGKPSCTVDQAATQILRDGASWHDLNGSGKIELTYRPSATTATVTTAVRHLLSCQARRLATTANPGTCSTTPL